MLEGKKVTIRTSNGFLPIPSDKYTCQIVDVNLVEQFSQFSGKTEDRLNYQFAILDPKKEDDNFQELRGRFLWKRCSPSLNEKAWLYKLAAAVKGGPMTVEEKESFDAESLVGKQVDVMVEVKPSKQDPTVAYSNIVSFVKTKKELETIEFEPKPTEIEKSSSPAVAPKEEDEFIKGLEKDKEEFTKDDVDEVFGKDK